MPNFSKARVGDRVFCAFGPDVKIGETNATILEIDRKDYPIGIQTDRGDYYQFTNDGLYFTGSSMPSLFWSKPEYTDPPMPKRKVKKWVAGFYHIEGTIWCRGTGARMRLFNSPEDAISKSAGSVAFVAEVEVDEIDKD